MYLKLYVCIIFSLPLISHKILLSVSVILMIWTLKLTFLRKYDIDPEHNTQLSAVYMKMTISRMLIPFSDK